MAKSTNSQVRAGVWVDPEQVEQLRTAAYADRFASYLKQRNEAIVTVLADTGLRVGELVGLDVKFLRNGNSEIFLPTRIQKDYPNENSPRPVPIGLADDTTRVVTSYLENRWKDSEALFPSRSADRITTQGVRDVVSALAQEAGILS